MRLGRSVNLPALLLFYAGRSASLLSYLFLVWLALRWMPFGKWILAVLALTPMALFQAATITPDAISNGIGFLFITESLEIVASEGLWLARIRKVGPAHLFALSGKSKPDRADPASVPADPAAHFPSEENLYLAAWHCCDPLSG